MVAGACPTQLGPYRLLEELGAGGMGVVHLAEHVDTGVHYALKTLSEIDPKARLRFLREGQALARVDRHPNVVRVHSLDQAEGRAFLVMGLARGGSLESRLRHGPLAPAEAAHVVNQLALGLAHVHAAGVLHRDLKPANVLFDEEGTPQLVDFGLAKVSSAQSLTQSGDLLGTPAYMAPEQAAGPRAALDERADVYGLGAVLYHCLTGRAPFGGGSAVAVLTKVLKGEPVPPRSLAPALPVELEAICVRALARDPQDRFQSASELALALDRFSSRGVGAGGPPIPWWLAGALLSVGLALVLALALRPEAAPPPELAEAPSRGSEAPSATVLQEAPPESVDPLSDVETWPIISTVKMSGKDRAAYTQACETLDGNPSQEELDRTIQTLERFAQLGHRSSLRRLGRLWCEGREGLLTPNAGLGLSLLRLALRGGDQVSAARLLPVFDTREARVLGLVYQTIGLDFGVESDRRLAVALGQLGAHDDKGKQELEKLNLTDSERLSEEEAWAVVQEAFEPLERVRAERRATAAVEAVLDQLPLEARSELEQVIARFPGNAVSACRQWGNDKRRLGDESGALFFYARGQALGSEGCAYQMAQVLVLGDLGVEAVPEAGLIWLFELAERGYPRAKLTLGRIYAAEGDWASVLEPDPAVAGAWYSLARRADEGDDEELNEQIQLGAVTPLEDSGNEIETARAAWRIVRKAMPYASTQGTRSE